MGRIAAELTVRGRLLIILAELSFYMPPETVALEPDDGRSPELNRVAGALREGAVVIFPTETVYGIGASAASESGMRRLQAIKHREATKPFTVHVGNRDSVEAFAPAVSRLGRRLIRKALPGPVTLIFEVSRPEAAAAYHRLSPAGVAAIYGSGKVGVRCPAHEVASGLAIFADVPMVASSANAAGDPPPAAIDQIAPAMLEEADYVIDSGATRYRKASTVVMLEGEGFQVLREGVLDERTIRRLARLTITFVCTGNTCRSPMAAGLCRAMLAKRLGTTPEALPDLGVIVQSAGVGGGPGAPATAEAVEACRRRGVNISGHRSQPLGYEVVNGSDYIFVMTAGHLEAVRSMLPLPPDRLMLLDETGDIADPIGGPSAHYEQAAEQIERALERRLEILDL